MNSWKEEIRKYEYKKNEEKKEFYNLKQTFRYESKPKERDFNLVTQKRKDKEEEKKISKKEKEKEIKIANKNLCRELNKTNLYNPINNLSKIPLNENPNPCKYDLRRENFFDKLKKKKGFNIVSNLDLNIHNFLPPEKCPEKMEKEIKNVKMKTKLTVLNRPRDFDIVSNRYFIMHEEKEEFDKKRDLFLASEKYAEEIRKKELSMKKKKRGRKYIEMKEKIEKVEKPRKSGISRIEFEKKVRKQMKEKESVQKGRALRRCTISKEKVLNYYTRGFNILTNK
eukprot:snap_masked-scaffold_23-processed-gene-1.28-mRNA-1 protein AED:1.00 eAED:1.00 QI:0/-1/0/0/-1/1/1/0/281